MLLLPLESCGRHIAQGEVLRVPASPREQREASSLEHTASKARIWRNSPTRIHEDPKMALPFIGLVQGKTLPPFHS